jgi:type IV pilus assembly protein PilE
MIRTISPHPGRGAGHDLRCNGGRAQRLDAANSGERAFTLIELMIVVAVVAILAAIAYPSYQKQIIKGSREAAESQLVELSNLQEKIFLNSSLYTGSVTAAYNGQSAGGLGVTSGTTSDGRYTLSLSPTTPSAAYTLTATPVATTSQAGDGNLTIDSTGNRLWGTASW